MECECQRFGLKHLECEIAQELRGRRGVAGLREEVMSSVLAY